MFTRIVLASFLTLSLAAGCHHGHRNPDKFIDKVSEKVANKLDLRAEQRPAYDALIAKVKIEMVTRQQKSRNALLEAKRELDKDTVDIDKIAALAKDRAKDRLTEEAMLAYIDEITAFYKTLDPKQQKIAADMARDKLSWLD